jgi:hypothetical protein
MVDAASDTISTSTDEIFANVKSFLTSGPSEADQPPANQVAQSPEEPVAALRPKPPQTLTSSQGTDEPPAELKLPGGNTSTETQPPNSLDTLSADASPDAAPAESSAGDGEVAQEGNDESLQSAVELEPIDRPPNPFSGNGDFAVGQSAPETESAEIEAAVDDERNTAPSTPTLRAAWMLGEKLGLAALRHQHKDVDAVDEQTLRSEVQALAELLDITIPNLPQDLSQENGPQIEELVRPGALPQARQVGSEIARRYDRQHLALFEVAFKSHLLLELYQPGSDSAGALSNVIQTGAEKALLPARLWQPLIDRLAEKPSQEDVTAAVYDLHEQVNEFLAKE